MLTLKGAEHLYRVFVETMDEGAVTVDGDSCIVYCNDRFASIIGVPAERVTGKRLTDMVESYDAPRLAAILGEAAHFSANGYVWLSASDGQQIPIHLSCVSIDLEGVAYVNIIVTSLSWR